MQKSDFEYDLPNSRIAVHPLSERDQSKLLVFKEGMIRDQLFTDLPAQLPPQSQLIFNNTRVVRARLHFVKTEGAKPIEIFCLGPHAQSVEEAMNSVHKVNFECLVGNLKRWKDHPLELALENGTILRAEKISRNGAYWVISFTWDSDLAFAQVLEWAGKIPLPPYMNRDASSDDVERYQTVYAHTNGSVAAPTAGLHFTDRVFQSLEKAGHSKVELTLHVGAGTFKPLGEGEIEAHQMHDEEIILSQQWLEEYLGHQGPKIAVGTTSLRSLESFHWIGAKLIETGELSPLGQFEAYTLNPSLTVTQTYSALLDALKQRGIMELALHTQLMIKPGYSFKTVKGIVTNFHQPGSTLLLLVSAGVGEQWRDIYTHALNHDYRFLSYGDSSLLLFQGN